MVTPLHIKNANIWSEKHLEQRDLFCTDVIHDKPAPDSVVVDLEGYTIFPGLINAHDHLELNHYPRTKFRDVYNNAHEWGEDVNARLDTEPYKSLRQYPIWDRLFIGGLKNLLCGATTVAHHGPKYREMYRKDFPVRVIRDYGWSHSLHFDSEEEILKSYQSTPKNHPWFIHLAEGTDEVAQGEYKRLKALGCVGENTVLVHSVGLTYDDAVDFYHTRNSHIGNGLRIIICPTTNTFLLDAVIHKRIIAMLTSVMIGSDSRLTADSDLLGEIQHINNHIKIHPRSWVLNSITEESAKIFDIQAGKLCSAYPADFIVIEGNSEDALLSSMRENLSLVIRGGIPQIGDPDIMAKFPHIKTVSALLDGVPKSINISLARQIQNCKLKEQGLELIEIPRRKFWFTWRK